MGRYKDSNTGNWVRETAMPIGDTLPIGSEVDYDGATVPYGWEQIDDNPKVLWTNSSPTSSFAAQDITVNNLGNYDFYEVIFITYADSSSQLSTRNFISTGRIPKGYRTRLMWFDEKLRYRNITNVTDSILGFSNGGVYDTYGSSSATSSNAICIPYQILGYK